MTVAQEYESMGKQAIPIQLGVQLLMQLRQLSVRVPSKLVGLEHGKYLIVSIPSLSVTDIKAYFTHGKIVVARYIHEGSALGFESVVMGMIIQPVRLVFLNYPKSIQDMNLRKHRRSDCYLPAEIVTDEDSNSGFILDISRGGCSFNCKSKTNIDVDTLSVGKKLTLKLAVPGFDGKLEIGCIIRNFRIDNANMIFGFQFDEIADEHKYKLYTYLDEMQMLEEDESS